MLLKATLLGEAMKVCQHNHKTGTAPYDAAYIDDDLRHRKELCSLQQEDSRYAQQRTDQANRAMNRVSLQNGGKRAAKMRVAKA